MTLRAQFQRAEKEGWLAAFRAAAERYEVRAEVLLGIASRESDMGGAQLPSGAYRWLTMPGDGGHGFGLMQIDGRSFPDWVETGAWQQASPGIFQGAAILAAKRHGLVRRAEQTIAVTDRKSHRAYLFKMPTFTDPAVLERVAISSYNAGDWAPYHLTKGRDIDFGTTGKDYSRDVLGRAELFRALMTPMSTEVRL